eukprot:TRINITY_DN8138_c0_g1_i1.p1 TRINITY_DN8138_c0_g1~~TRINITY_DN8138_c0_g1_i1.p1  ORF type:complete len:487 (-),score=100.44 TRINITY_DN8138_c0_g1_i1:141-1601(-)
MGAAHGGACGNSRRESIPWRRSGLAEATFFDVYEVGALLGSGSFGQVRLCWLNNDPDKRQLAVKAIDTKSELFETAGPLISAKREANILQSVSHPHIVELFEVFEKERWLFLVTECIEGGEVFKALANPRVAITEGCVGNVGRQLFQALQHLHDLQVVHRDVKAENILLLADPARTKRWHIKLIDFGLAMRCEQSSSFVFKMCQQEAPLEQLICGTAYYCAPEVWFNDYGPSVDVWAAGVVLYLALFGAFPYYDRDPSAIEALICSDDHEPSYMPSCHQESSGFQVSDLACECLKELLRKAQEDRPTAAEVLRLPWLEAAASFEGAAEGPSLSSTFMGSQKSASVGGVQLLGDWDQVIPPSIRAKAGRAAAGPIVETSKEMKRTAALEEMKLRSSPGGNGGRKGVPTPLTRRCVNARSADVVDVLLEAKGVPQIPGIQSEMSSCGSEVDSDGESQDTWVNAAPCTLFPGGTVFASPQGAGVCMPSR